MTRSAAVDAVVVGAGPNGLAAAITLARAERSVLVLEGSDQAGGGARSAALTLPGFVHDICSAILPLARASPFLRDLPLRELGCELVDPEIPLAHPLGGDRAAVLERSVDDTAAGLGRDRSAYRKLMAPLVRSADDLARAVLGGPRIPRRPLSAARFALPAVRSVTGLASSRFESEAAPALLAGLGAHSFLPLDSSPSAGFALLLGLLGHAVGWPAVAGGTQRFADALVAHLQALGGELRCGSPVRSMADVPPSRVVLFDVTPRQLTAIAGDEIGSSYRRKLARFRYGPGVFKVDWALTEPIPWSAPQCRRAGTVHVGGPIAEVAAAESEVARNVHCERPFVLAVQPSNFDSTRAPAGAHTGWAYCHVPNGSTVDMTDRIEDQIERFAPGFRDTIAARHTMTAADMQRHNPNLVGGDINGGIQDWGQLFTRPVRRFNPYSTGSRRIFICSASSPPGGGVHGMCGHLAARTALGRALA